MVEISGGLDIEDGDPPTRKKGGIKFRKANLAIRIMYGVISNEPVNKKVAILNWGKNEDFTVQPLPLVNFLLKKETRLHVKHFGINHVHKIFGFVNSQIFLINN